MNRKVKIGIVGILLLAIMIPAAMSLNVGSGQDNGTGPGAGPGAGAGNTAKVNPGGPTPGKNIGNPTPSWVTPQMIQQANSIVSKALDNTTKGKAVLPNIANPVYGYSTDLQLWECCLQDWYAWYNYAFIPIKAEVWDYWGNRQSNANVYESIYYWDGSNWQYYTSGYQTTGPNGDNAQFTWIFASGWYWYTLIEGYYYDINGNVHYAYQIKYIST